MTDPFDEVLDPWEPVLSRRVRSFSDHALVPVDAIAIARDASAVAGSSTVLGRIRGSSGSTARLGWILAAGLLAIAVIGGAVIGGSNGFFVPRPTATASPDPGIPSWIPRAPDGTPLCNPNDVEARITAWEGAAGHRIATVELPNDGPHRCFIESLPEVWLVDSTGEPMLVGPADRGAGIIRIDPGEVVRTFVQVGNYCGREPKPPIMVAFLNEGAMYVSEALTPTDLSGVPPCNGPEGPANDIQMQPWSNSEG